MIYQCGVCTSIFTKQKIQPSHYLEKQCEEIRCISCGCELENICVECDEYYIKISDLKHHMKI